MWGKILTNDNLRKRATILVERCSLCRCSGETMDHLLINCDYVYACGAIWNLAPLCLMGILWREQSYHTFKDVQVSEIQLKTYFLGLICEWLMVLGWSQ